MLTWLQANSISGRSILPEELDAIKHNPLKDALKGVVSSLVKIRNRDCLHAESQIAPPMDTRPIPCILGKHAHPQQRATF